MIVVADTSPINYLILIERVDVLWRLYGRVILPEGVAAELAAQRAHEAVRAWVAHPPGWLEVRRVEVPTGSGLEEVDMGEAQAIALAASCGPKCVAADRRPRRPRVAANRGIAMTGTLGVLNSAAKNGLINVGREATAGSFRNPRP